MSHGVQAAVEVAREARKRAVPPVSGFYVGACAITSDRTMIPGANVEEAAVNGTIHAEPCAVTGANAHGQRDVLEVVVCADSGNPDEFIYPCQHCWQWLCNYAEMLGHPIKVYGVRSEGDGIVMISTDDPPPKVFSYGDLGIDLSPWRPT